MPAEASGLAVFAAPGRYIQGRNALSSLGAELERLKATKPLVLLDPAVREVVGPAVESVGGAHVVEFRGECSPGEIDRVAPRRRRTAPTRSSPSGAARRSTRPRRSPIPPSCRS